MGHFVTLAVADDGVGMPDAVMGGHGLANIGNRAHDLGGDFEIRVGDDGGSTLV